MYTYMGEMFKEIRQARHISLKKAAGEAFSYSLLSRFENGEAEIAASKLMQALENIHMDLSEFSYLVKGFQPSAYALLQKQIWEAQIQGNLTKLTEMYEEAMERYQQSSDQVDAVLQALIIKAHILVLDDSVAITDQEIAFLSDYLFSIEIWGKYELRLFTEISPLLPLDLYYRYAREMMVKTDYFKKIPTIRNYIHTVLLNGFFKAIDEEAISKAVYFKQQIEAFFFEENETYLRIVYLFGCGQFVFLTEDREKGKQQMEDAVATLKLLDCQNSAAYYENNMLKWLERFA